MAMNVEVSWLYSVEWWPTNYIKILKLKLHWVIVSFLHTVAWSVCNIKTGIFPRSRVPRLNFNTNYFVLLRRKLCCCQYSTIVLCFSLSMSWFQPIFVLFFTISVVLRHCFKTTLLVGIYPNRASVYACLLDTAVYLDGFKWGIHSRLCFKENWREPSALKL